MRTKERIIKAALDLFSKKGFTNVSMDEIKDKAGVAKGTLYYYFKDKMELFNSACNYFSDQIEKEIKETVKEIESPKKRFKVGIITLIRFLYQRIDTIKLFFMVKKGPPHDFKLVDKVFSEIKMGLQNCGFDENEARNITPLIIGLWTPLFPAVIKGYLTDIDLYIEKVNNILDYLIGD
jgi:TetR/AcrR family fatty acid metabolism transcriptional regulator